MSGELASYEKDGAVATVTLNRPQDRNSIADLADCDSLVAAIERANADPGVSCLVLTGAGSAFCSGGNMRAMHERRGIGAKDSAIDTRGNYKKGVQRVIRALWDLEVPAIAAVNGPAMGLGCGLACLCDIRYAGESARFASSFVNIALIPGDGGAWSLQRAVGYSKAAELIFTGEPIDATEALACGLVSKVLPDAALLPAARELAARIAAKPARTLRLSKRLLRESQHGRLSDILELSAAFQAMAHETTEHREAVTAFLEKRTGKG
jgi:2-(1,2-epoxy-1,2-dihydrophenyl)acetyl-CoA isomerase